MTPIKPEDRAKVIGLIVAVILVFGMAVYQILPKSGGSAPVVPGAAVTTETVPGPITKTAPGGVTPGGVTPGAADNAASPPVTLPNLNNNPFRNIAGVAPGTIAPGSGNNNGTAAQNAAVTERAPGNRLPAPGAPPVAGYPPNYQSPVPPGAGIGALPPVSSPVPPVTPLPIPEPVLDLLGIVEGRPSIALIRTASRQHFVQVGEKIAGYRVAKILTDSVLLQRGKQQRTLRVDDPQSAAPNGNRPVAPAPLSLPALRGPAAQLPAARMPAERVPAERVPQRSLTVTLPAAARTVPSTVAVYPVAPPPAPAPPTTPAPTPLPAPVESAPPMPVPAAPPATVPPEAVPPAAVPTSAPSPLPPAPPSDPNAVIPPMPASPAEDE